MNNKNNLIDLQQWMMSGLQDGERRVTEPSKNTRDSNAFVVPFLPLDDENRETNESRLFGMLIW